jgi:para-aminobenzoate synthetase component 1
VRKTKKFHLEDPELLKKNLFLWSKQFCEIAWLDSNLYKQHHSNFEAILAVEAFTALKTDFSGAFEQLHEFQQVTKDWIFGYLSYDLKNDVEDLKSTNFDGLGFPDLYFFQPQKILMLKGNVLEMHYLFLVEEEMDIDYEEILSMKSEEPFEETYQSPQDLRVKKEKSLEKVEGSLPKTVSENQDFIRARITKAGYLEKVRDMLFHIQNGDIYEANFCQEFYVQDREIEPFTVFTELNEISIPPFAVFLKMEDHYLLCASPERYLKKTGKNIHSQPIKGTARRSENEKEDYKIAAELSADPKERSENIMIVDLVRNDLSKVAKKGSVEVAELCKVYSFKQVHQMISTVSAELEEGIPPVEVLRATFPMGSMTGAPKISAMKIIEKLEETKRGLYSGAVGYFTPEGDFDFNVVIRSILYNAANRYVSFSVGGAITARSVPELEYEECLLKSEAMRKVLNQTHVISSGKA